MQKRHIAKANSWMGKCQELYEKTIDLMDALKNGGPAAPDLATEHRTHARTGRPSGARRPVTRRWRSRAARSVASPSTSRRDRSVDTTSDEDIDKERFEKL